MPWTTPTEALVIAQFTPDESATIQAIQGASDSLPGILALVIAEMRDAIRAGGYAVDAGSSSTLPLGLHNDCVALARWRWVAALPQLGRFQTDDRREAAEMALEKLARIAAQRWSVEPPSAVSTSPAGNWNSENKLILRTHPLPRPSQQFPEGATDYANSGAPADQ